MPVLPRGGEPKIRNFNALANRLGTESFYTIIRFSGASAQPGAEPYDPTPGSEPLELDSIHEG
jgi:hypothetical protein